MITAIIAAAGAGIRFGSDAPKVLLDLCGKSVLSHSIDAFEAAKSIDELVIVVPKDRFHDTWSDVTSRPARKPHNWTVGGKTRAESVRNGFRVMEKATELVVIHDAARPLVNPLEIDEVVAKAVRTGAACLVVGINDTIKEIADDRIVRTIDRNIVRRALTPQAFRYAILRDALASSDLGEDVTDECYLVEKLGIPIAFVEGSPRNIKITHPNDIRLAEFFMKQDE